MPLVAGHKQKFSLSFIQESLSTLTKQQKESQKYAIYYLQQVYTPSYLFPAAKACPICQQYPDLANSLNEIPSE